MSITSASSSPSIHKKPFIILPRRVAPPLVDPPISPKDLAYNDKNLIGLCTELRESMDRVIYDEVIDTSECWDKAIIWREETGKAMRKIEDLIILAYKNRTSMNMGLGYPGYYGGLV